MASYQLTENKKGLYCRLIVSIKKPDGKNGLYTQRWEIPQGLTKRQIEKAAQRAADDLEEKMKDGFKVNQKESFHDFAVRVINRKQTFGDNVASTEDFYMGLLSRIDDAFGYMDISDIRAHHIENFCLSLRKNGAKKSCEKAVSKGNLRDIIKERGITPKNIIAAGLESPYKRAACGKNILYKNGIALAQFIGVPFDTVFDRITETGALSLSTVQHHYKFIHLVLEQAVREKIITYNYANDVDIGTMPKHTANYFQPDVRDQILSVVDAKASEDKRLLVYLFILTGCRRGEIAGLKWENIDFSENVIEIASSLNYSKKCGVYEGSTKGKKTRYVKIPSEVTQMLREHRKLQMELRIKNADIWDSNSSYVFTQKDGKPINPTSITMWMSRFSKLNGLQHINPHAFRHTAASTMIANGVDVVTVSSILGHAQPSTTTNMYAHEISKAKAAASEVLSDVVLKRNRA